MSQENVEIVERAIAAVNERDIDAYLARCTQDIQLHTPVAAIVGVYEGAAGIRRFFDDLRDTIPDFRLTIERLDAIGADCVLAFLRISASGRASGITQAAATPSANVCTTSLAARSGVSESSSTVRRPSR